MSETTLSIQMLMDTYLATTLDHVYFKDRDGRFILVSDSLARSFGCKPQDVVGRTDHDFFSEPIAHGYRQVEVDIMTTRSPIVAREVKHVWPDGHFTWSLNDAQPIVDGDEVLGIMGTNKDITAKKLLELEVAAQTHRADLMTQQAVEEAKRNAHLAYHDSLTGLPNRSLFTELLNQSIKEAQRFGRQTAVAFLDLDRFKQVNDTLGHEAGDQLLQEVARRLKESVRDSDTVARLGGDEFVVLLPELEHGKHAAPAAQKMLSALARPFTLLGHEFRVTGSIGISVYPQHGQDEQTLKKHADIAMYHAKEAGKNNFQFYSDELSAKSLERLTLESSLRRALERNEFRLHYQAKRDISSGCVTGMEALLRWEHPDFGTVAPMKFIPIAEETGLIVPIGKWVLEAACLQNMTWQKQGLPVLNVAVNLTARQIFDPQLLSQVKSILATTGMDPRLLELEIAESLLIQDVERTLRILTHLKTLGIRIAIDDFGTGYSSVATLQRFPVDTVKIDRSFVRDITNTTQNAALADAVIAMGRTLSLTVVAQGVETKEQAEFLRAHTCDELQGFYFSRPLPADEFTKLLHGQSAGITYTGKRLALKDE